MTSNSNYMIFKATELPPKILEFISKYTYVDKFLLSQLAREWGVKTYMKKKFSVNTSDNYV